MGQADIRTTGWIALLPQSVRPYAILARLDRPIGTWLLLLPGWWAIALAGGGWNGMGALEWFMFALFGIGAVIMRGAGCVVNDLWDRDLDRQVERTRGRPLASGAVSVHQALIFLGGLLAAGFVILLQLPLAAVALGILSLPLIAVYPLMKRWTWWPQLFLGLTFNFGALMGWAAVTGWIGLPALLLYASGIFWTLGYDTIYAHQDREDDALAGIKSTALRFGADSKKWVAGFYGVSWVLAVMALMADGSSFSSIFMGLPAVHLIWQLTSWKTASSTSSLRIFRTNRDYGFLILVIMLIFG